jgi:Holliday junction resolvase
MKTLADLQTERAFQRQVCDLLKLYGWWVSYHWSSLHSPRGWPDVFALKGGRALALELKTERGRVRPEQVEWIAALNEIPGITARVCRPSDWDWLEAAAQAPTPIRRGEESP